MKWTNEISRPQGLQRAVGPTKGSKSREALTKCRRWAVNQRMRLVSGAPTVPRRCRRWPGLSRLKLKTDFSNSFSQASFSKRFSWRWHKESKPKPKPRASWEVPVLQNRSCSQAWGRCWTRWDNNWPGQMEGCSLIQCYRHNISPRSVIEDLIRLIK